MPRIDLSGQKFGRLTVVRYYDTKGNRARWLCKCDCGNEKIVITTNLKRNTVSCGCYRNELTSNMSRKHGMFGTRIYSIWAGMKKRCSNVNDANYENYGGRGISFCDEWSNFDSFYDWAINNCYSDELTLERKDVNKDYSPSNCIWASMESQANNKRNNVLVEIDGEIKTVAEWAKTTGVPYMKIYKRVRRGWTGRAIIGK